MNKQFTLFVQKVAVLGGVVALFFVWQALLPVQQYAFRAWDGLLAQRGVGQTVFLPNQKLSLTEVGDLAPYTRQAVPKQVTWTIDENGFRNDTPLCLDPEVVVFGDSMAIGGSLDQSQTFVNQLKTVTQKCVIGLTGAKPSQPWGWMKHLGYHPKTVVVILVERNLGGISDLIQSDRRIYPFSANSALIRASNLRKLVYWNYRFKHGVFQALVRSFGSFASFLPLYAPAGNYPEAKMLFVGETFKSENYEVSEVSKWIEEVNTFADQLKKDGAKLIVALVPNKESIYFNRIGVPRPHFYDRLKQSLKNTPSRFQFVDLFEPYQTSPDRLYQTDDSHWNDKGVSVLVRKVLPLLPTS